MHSDHELLRSFLDTIHACNDSGTFDPLEAIIADSVSVIGGDTVVASSRAEWLQALREARARGFIAQHHVATTVRDGLLTTQYVNHMEDGTQTSGAGVVAFDDDGKIVAARTLGTPATRPPVG